MTIREKTLGSSSDLAVIDLHLDVESKFLIDAGCGNMHVSRALAERGAAVLAIDPDPLQAEKNRQAETIANVGFAETPADSLPVEPASIDGILFPYSFHHIPVDRHEAVFDEISRVLKPDGFVYAMEPLAEGSLDAIMRLFHNEQEVRSAARKTLDRAAAERFTDAEFLLYSNRVAYDSWEHFSHVYTKKSYNSYAAEDVRNDKVRDAFETFGKPTGYAFDSPMRITWMRNPVPLNANPA